MKPLIVRYEKASTKREARHAKELVIKSLSAEFFDTWRRMIEDGTVDEVVITGPACTGWRIWVDREVRFEAKIPEDRHEAMCQEQASHRIVRKDGVDVETTSPFCLVQEFLPKDKHYPWRVLVACTLLNRTHGRQVRPAIERLMQLCQTPEDMLWPPNELQILAILQPLGLKNVRYKRLRQLTRDYLDRKKFSEIAGVGPYALDSIDLFCWGDTDLQPTDQWLEPYRQWRLNGGPRVRWDYAGWRSWMDEK